MSLETFCFCATLSKEGFDFTSAKVGALKALLEALNSRLNVLENITSVVGLREC